MSTHHTIDYVEFNVRDLAATKRFYTAVFGWQYNDYGPEYAGVKGPAGEVAGFYETTDARTRGPIVLLFSEDLEQTLASVRSAGGTIQREPFAFPGGRRFHFADPSGNELGVWART
jgi:predicted enzyme related to lactoylglutathione lyase